MRFDKLLPNTTSGPSDDAYEATSSFPQHAPLGEQEQSLSSSSIDTSTYHYHDGEEIEQSWHCIFIVLAYVIAFIGAYAAIRLMEHGLWRSEREAQNATSVFTRYPFLATAFVLGSCTIWSMHFIGMQAVKLEHTSSFACYHLGETVASLVLAVTGVWAGIHLASRDIFNGTDRIDKLRDLLKHDPIVSSKSNRQKASQRIHMVALLYRLHWIAAGSILVALGALSMHFLGMDAMKGPYRREWSMVYLAASVFVGLVVAFAGMWILFRPLHWKTENTWYRHASAMVIALAVCALHFFGMLSVTYIHDNTIEYSTCETIGGWMPDQLMVLCVAIAVPSLAFYVEHTIANELRTTHQQLLTLQMRSSNNGGEGASSRVFSKGPRVSRLSYTSADSQSGLSFGRRGRPVSSVGSNESPTRPRLVRRRSGRILISGLGMSETQTTNVPTCHNDLTKDEFLAKRRRSRQAFNTQGAGEDQRDGSSNCDCDCDSNGKPKADIEDGTPTTTIPLVQWGKGDDVETGLSADERQSQSQKEDLQKEYDRSMKKAYISKFTPKEAVIAALLPSEESTGPREPARQYLGGHQKFTDEKRTTTAEPQKRSEEVKMFRPREANLQDVLGFMSTASGDEQSHLSVDEKAQMGGSVRALLGGCRNGDDGHGESQVRRHSAEQKKFMTFNMNMIMPNIQQVFNSLQTECFNTLTKHTASGYMPSDTMIDSSFRKNEVVGKSDQTPSAGNDFDKGYTANKRNAGSKNRISPEQHRILRAFAGKGSSVEEIQDIMEISLSSIHYDEESSSSFDSDSNSSQNGSISYESGADEDANTSHTTLVSFSRKPASLSDLVSTFVDECYKEDIEAMRATPVPHVIQQHNTTVDNT